MFLELPQWPFCFHPSHFSSAFMHWRYTEVQSDLFRYRVERYKSLFGVGRPIYIPPHAQFPATTPLSTVLQTRGTNQHRKCASHKSVIFYLFNTDIAPTRHIFLLVPQRKYFKLDCSLQFNFNPDCIKSAVTRRLYKLRALSCIRFLQWICLGCGETYAVADCDASLLRIISICGCFSLAVVFEVNSSFPRRDGVCPGICREIPEIIQHSFRFERSFYLLHCGTTVVYTIRSILVAIVFAGSFPTIAISTLYMFFAHVKIFLIYFLGVGFWILFK